MRVKFLQISAVALALVALSCAARQPAGQRSGPPLQDLSRVRFSGGDGSNCENRVIITGAPNNLGGVQAERVWLSKRYPGFTKEGQSLFTCDGKPADRITIRTAQGETLDVVFDISDFFGK